MKRILIVYSDTKCSCTKKCTFELAKGLNKYINTDTLFYKDLKEDHFKEYNVILFQRLGGNGAKITQEYIESLEKYFKNYPKVLTSYFLDD